MPTNTNRNDTEMNPTAGSAQANWWQTTSRETTNVSEPAAFAEPAGGTQQAAGNASGGPTVDTNPVASSNNNNLHRSETLPIPEPLIIIPGDLSVAGPMLDLPPIRPPELKIIGRSVSFVADCVEKGELRDYYYQGMVAQITRDTVTMLEVLKFTVEGYAAYKAKGQNNAPANAAATESQTQSRIVAVGTPLPRRNRRQRNTNSTAPAGDGNAHTIMGSSAASVAERGESVSVAPSFLSPESVAGNNSTAFVPPHVMSPPHPADGPNSVTAAANNFSIDASIVGGSARAGTQLYDYNAYNQQNHYINSSTLMPDTGPRAGNNNVVLEANAGAVTPYITTNHSDDRQRASPSQPGGTGTALDSLLPILDPVPSACDKAPVWKKDQPLAHFKFMTFARRKIRKVEFSTDHPMAGLVEPFYVSHFFRPHWEPNPSIINNGPDAAVVGPAQNDTNGTHNHNPYGNEAAAPTNEPIANVSPQEMARRAKEKAKKKWQAQQAADSPIPLEIPLSYSKLIVGKERNTSHPFMGINLRVIDPNGYRRRKALYKQELRDFFEKNEKARELASCALLPRLSEAQNNNSINIPLSEDADATVVNQKHDPKRGAGQNDATIENELGNPAVDSTPYGGTTEESSRRLLASVTSTHGAESSSSSEDDDDDDSGANERPKNNLSPDGNQVVANSENSGKARPNDTEGMDASLASASRARGLKKFKPKSTVSTLGGGDDEDKADLWGGGISLKLVDPQTLEKLIAEGVPPRPSAYEYPTSLSELYDDPKWRNGNPYILQDLERVRMFVRRFLVHTSQGNNQRQIPLSVFIAQRCPWPNPSESVLREILYAELTSLIKIESELVAKASNTRGASTNTTNHPNIIGEAGEEVSPGRLLLAETGVIARTTYLAISHIAVSIGLLLYSASAFSSLEKYFVASYASNLAAWVVAAAATHLFLGAASGFHALKMKAPVDLCHASPRLLMESVSFTLMLLSLIQLIVLMAGKRNLFKNITEEEEWMRLVRSENEDSCNFMIKNSCSGYSQLCSTNPNQCLATCLGYVLSYTETCEDSVGAAVRNSLLPILCIVAICFVFICIDIAYNLRYARVASRLARALS